MNSIPSPHSNFENDRGRSQGRSHWRQSLVDTETGLRTGLRADATIAVYFFAFSVVLAAASVARLTASEWAFVILSLAAVLASQMFYRMMMSLKELIPEGKGAALEATAQFGVAAVTVTNLGAFGALTILLLPRFIQLL